jgi:uncharacterized membrane protein YecN with MAPEG domain
MGPGGNVISALYASILALLIVWLALRVIKLRRAKRVVLGDGGDPELQAAIRAHGNATEYIPIALILLVLLELNGAHAVLLHSAGIAVLAGRLLHAKGILAEQLQYRVLGMQSTFFALIGLAAANLAYALFGG